jgi:hypothetical protein
VIHDIGQCWKAPIMIEPRLSNKINQLEVSSMRAPATEAARQFLQAGKFSCQSKSERHKIEV